MKEEQIDKLRKQLLAFNTVVLITQGASGPGHARPMAVARVDDNCDLWFFTSVQSAKVKELADDARAQVICQDGWTSCVVLVGRAALVRDRALVGELWKPAFQVWFPGGADDPDLVLIHLTGERAEYWDNTGVNRLSYLYQSVKAAVQGTTPEIEEGRQHGTVALGA